MRNVQYPDYGPPEFDTALGAKLRAEQVRLQRHVLTAVEQAVRGWADKMGITVESWLKLFQPDVRIERGEGTMLNVTVTAKMREDALPFSFTVDL